MEFAPSIQSHCQKLPNAALPTLNSLKRKGTAGKEEKKHSGAASPRQRWPGLSGVTSVQHRTQRTTAKGKVPPGILVWAEAKPVTRQQLVFKYKAQTGRDTALLPMQHLPEMPRVHPGRRPTACPWAGHRCSAGSQQKAPAAQQLHPPAFPTAGFVYLVCQVVKGMQSACFRVSQHDKHRSFLDLACSTHPKSLMACFRAGAGTA